MKTITLYVCEGCHSRYETEEKARACEARGFEPKFEVGDIVLAQAGFGWFDGDPAWIENFDRIGRKRSPFDKPRENADHGNCFDACCTYRFFYVVTAVDHSTHDYSFDGAPAWHRPRYHLATLAMTGKSGYGIGYTFDEHHKTPRKVENPPDYVVETSKRLLGKKAPTLL